MHDFEMVGKTKVNKSPSIICVCRLIHARYMSHSQLCVKGQSKLNKRQLSSTSEHSH